jgi:hypothetical protein
MNKEAWALFCEISLWLWVFAAIGFIINAFPSRNIFRKRPATVWGTGLLFFYTFWVIGMIKA